MTDPSCSVLSKDEHALHFFTHCSLWFSISVQLAGGGRLLLVQTVCVLLAWARTMVPGPVLGNIEPVLHQGSVVPGHALYSCSEERCKMLNGVL